MSNAKTSLESFVETTVSRAKSNRGQLVTCGDTETGVSLGTEQKWASNLLAAIPPHVLPSVAGFRNAWRGSDGKEQWSSRAKSGSSANALAAIHDFFDDVLFGTGNVPFRIGLVDSHGQNLPIPAEQQAMEEERLEKHLDQRHAKCQGVKQLLSMTDSCAMYGPRYVHCFLTDDANEKSGMRPAFEDVNVWECCEDMDNQGELEDGEFFMRRQRKSKRQLVKWAKQINKTSVAQHGGEQISMQYLRASFAVDNGGVGVNNTSSQTGTPETDDLQYKNKTEVFDELWIWCERQMVDEYIANTPGSVPYVHPDATEVVDDQGNVIGMSQPEFDPDESVWCLVHLNNDRMVGLLPEPGPLPYRRGEWHRMPGCRDALGVCDRNATNQQAQDGMMIALENDVKHARTIVGYKTGALVNGNRMEDMLARPIGYLEMAPDMAGSIDGIIKVFNMPTNTEVYLKALEFFQRMSDMDTGVPRIQQGMKSEGGNPAFELKQRLDNSGRHIGSKIRSLDEDIVWINAWMLKMDVELGNIELPSDVEIKGGGFRKFSKQLSATSTLMAMMQLAKQFPEINDRMNMSWVLAEYAEAQGQDPEKYWISEPEYQKKLQARRESPAVQAQQAQLQAAIDKIKAATAKDNAQAQKALAEAESIAAGIGHDESRLQLDRAKGAMEIADKMRGANTRMDRRAEAMAPSRIVKMPTASKAA